MSQDWPHDPDGDEGSEGRRKYGHAVIAKKVDDEADFPLDVSEFVADHGDDPVRIDHETVVPLRDIFAEVDADSFDGIQEMHRALGRAMREHGFWAYEGVEASAPEPTDA